MTTPSPKIKICGIAHLDDAFLAAQLGAAYLGFNFYPPSPRSLTPDRAQSIIAQLPSTVASVGVFVNEPLDHVRRVADQCSLDIIQLHGNESPDYCQKLRDQGYKLIKAFRISSPGDLENHHNFPADYLLYDAYHPKLYGGSGDTFDWSWITQTTLPTFLAGGINPQNIAQARTVPVFALDLCSGVEADPPRKDPEKLRKIFRN